MIGSANLTSGLLGNIETGVRLRGPDQSQPMRQAWELGEDLWRHPLARPWEPSDSEPGEPLDSALLAALAAVLPIGGSFPTLGQGKPNRVMSVSPAGLTVATQTSISKGVPPQPVEAWMLELAWTALQERGVLTYNELTNELHVHRSSVVLAALAQLPNVIVTSTLRHPPGDESERAKEWRFESPADDQRYGPTQQRPPAGGAGSQCHWSRCWKGIRSGLGDLRG